MTKIKVLKSILRSIYRHPLAGKHKARAISKFLFWQVRNFIHPKERKVTFTDRTVLVVKKGMAGATGNIYMGLHEFEDMAFLLHFLRPEDLFFDIGANVGSYTVLASGHVGARTIAFEPIPQTFRSLEKNISANDAQLKVSALNYGVGARRGKLLFTASLDTVNHVVDKREQNSAELIQVEVISIDSHFKPVLMPSLIKIDVEGFETEVLEGMEIPLNSEKLKAIIIELNGSGMRYGYDEEKIHLKLTALGFSPFNYNPFRRTFQSQKSFGNFNTLYLRDMDFVKKRIATADKVNLFSESF